MEVERQVTATVTAAAAATTVKARAIARTDFITPPALSGAELDAPRKDK